jgi:hypothetical protein
MHRSFLQTTLERVDRERVLTVARQDVRLASRAVAEPWHRDA